MEFEHLAGIDDQEMLKLFKRSRVDITALAFKNAPENVKEKFFGVIDPVHAEFIRENMARLENPSPEEVEKARDEILKTLQKIRAE
ncbi:MAG: hypothetical protein HY928_00715 [Elusimicrobia bacterium]|nr:hypothetical protein [Elusimicrobiota bacterium]